MSVHVTRFTKLRLRTSIGNDCSSRFASIVYWVVLNGFEQEGLLPLHSSQSRAYFRRSSATTCLQVFTQSYDVLIVSEDTASIFSPLGLTFAVSKARFMSNAMLPCNGALYRRSASSRSNRNGPREGWKE